MKVNFVKKIFLFFIFIYCLFWFNQYFWLHLLFRLFGRIHQSFPVFDNEALKNSICEIPKKVLYGIFTTADHFEKRMIVRSKTKKCHLNDVNHSTVFVIGRPEKELDYKRLKSEIFIYKDVFVLNCKENMNDGKTFEYFYQAVSELPCFELYAKVDDDTAFKASEITKYISELLPTAENVYMGKKRLNEDSSWFGILKKSFYFRRNMNWLQHFGYYHAGLLYILSKDVIKRWIHMRPKHLYGDEDMRTAFYMHNLNATVIDFGNHFHQIIQNTLAKRIEIFFKNIQSLFFKLIAIIPEEESSMDAPITNVSMAVHYCKDSKVLSEVFDVLCQS